MEKQLNVLGAEGWELVKISEIIGPSMTVSTVALIATLKRTAEWRGDLQGSLHRALAAGPHAG